MITYVRTINMYYGSLCLYYQQGKAVATILPLLYGV